MKKVLFTVVVLILVATFGVSAFMVGNYLIDGKKQAERYNELSDIAANAQTEEKANATEGTAESADPEEKLKKVSEKRKKFLILWEKALDSLELFV